MEKQLGGRRKHIVVVDDNPVNLDLVESVLKDTYKVTKLISGVQLLKFLQRVRPDLILLDIQMPELDGYNTLSIIRADHEWDDIPVIFLTGQKDCVSEQQGFRLGAQDFIGKPFNTEVALSRIRAQLELYQYRTDLEGIIQEKTREIEELQHVITVSWAEMVESRDGTTGSHVRNTARYYEALLGFLVQTPVFERKFPPEQRGDFIRASYLHDIGKISISDQVLKKPGPLTPEEFDCMKTHTTVGAEVIRKVMGNSRLEGFLQYAERMALWHHERWDGSGYPHGLKGEQIPIYVQVLSIADVYDALTSVRPYKRAFTHSEALDIMKEDRGKFFSPSLFDVFLQHEACMRAVLEAKCTTD